jgi:hypothetical protein
VVGPTERERYWRRIIAKQRRSGLSHTAFCEAQSLSKNTYLEDNCPLVSNSEQTDSDEDGAGDACEGVGPFHLRRPRGMRVLLDTNILTRSYQDRHQQRSTAVGAVAVLRARVEAHRGCPACVSASCPSSIRHRLVT